MLCSDKRGALSNNFSSQFDWQPLLGDFFKSASHRNVLVLLSSGGESVFTRLLLLDFTRREIKCDRPARRTGHRVSGLFGHAQHILIRRWAASLRLMSLTPAPLISA